MSRNWVSHDRASGFDRAGETRSMPLTSAQAELLQAIANGATLKSHRDLEGHKDYRLHTLAGHSTSVSWEDVAILQSVGLIDSNKKFPAATYWLTNAGREYMTSA